jgi:hypothetical protein
MGLFDDPVANSLIQLEPCGRAEQRPGFVPGQAVDREFRQVHELLARYTGCEDNPDPLGQQAPGDEREGAPWGRFSGQEAAAR